MTPKLTIVIPVLNNIERYEPNAVSFVDTVEALYKYTPPIFRIICVFNGTDEDYMKVRAKLGDKVHMWIKPYRNLGFGKSMNLGIKLAQTEYVLVANDDVQVLNNHWWQDVEALFEKYPNLGGFNPHSFINKAHTGDRVIQYELKDEYTEEDDEKMKAIFHSERWYTGGCTYFTICKKAMFDKIGLFDESFGLGSGEDYDLDVRASRAGYLIAGGSVVMVKHWWGGTKDNMPKDTAFVSGYDLIAKGNQNMSRKWGPHCQEVERQLADGRLNEETAKVYKGGWSVAGAGGPDEPFDKDEVKYPDGKWYQEVDL